MNSNPKLQQENVEETKIAERESIDSLTASNDVHKEIVDDTYQIFDKVFKKILTLSAKAVINLINGLFDTDYSLNSTITYNWTEFVDGNLKRILADTIITINGRSSYHLEAQIEKDNSIVFRVFEYGFGHANRTRISDNGRYVMHFPKPMVIYLYYEGSVPDEYTLTLDFNDGKDCYDYKVPVLKLPELSAQELSERKMVILIPFHVLRLRYALKNHNFISVSELQSHILHDILGCIDENLRLENITVEDAVKLKSNFKKLCDYLSKHHKELEGIYDMTDESFMTEVDIMCKEHEEALELLERSIEENEEKIATMKEQLANLDKELADTQKELNVKDKELADRNLQLHAKDKELAELKKLLATLNK